MTRAAIFDVEWIVFVANSAGAASSSCSAAASNAALDAIEIERKRILADCRKEF